MCCVTLSGGIFTGRGLLMLAGSAWTNHPWVKQTSYVNDSILLTAGLTLMFSTQQYPPAEAWLSVKLTLLVIYIVLGVFALRAGRSKTYRGIFFVAAIGVYLFMISVARSHDPLGLLTTHTLY